MPEDCLGSPEKGGSDYLVARNKRAYAHFCSKSNMEFQFGRGNFQEETFKCIERNTNGKKEEEGTKRNKINFCNNKENILKMDEEGQLHK